MISFGRPSIKRLTSDTLQCINFEGCMRTKRSCSGSKQLKMKLIIRMFAGIFLFPVSAHAVLPVAPFTAPSKLSIPSNIPVIPSGIYDKADWLNIPSSKPSVYRTDHYIHDVRRRGNIVSFYLITRSQRKETPRLNRNTKNYGSGMFLPGYRVAVRRYDCVNDKYSTEIFIVDITDAHGDGEEGGYIYYLDRNETKYKYVPGQEKVYIEGRPYWAIASKKAQYWQRLSSGRSELDGGADDWNQIRPGSYGASHIDYACNSL